MRIRSGRRSVAAVAAWLPPALAWARRGAVRAGRRRPHAAVVPLALALGATSCTAESEPFDPKPGPTVSIAMTVGAFRPAVDTVEVGSRVIWENQSDQSHTVTADEGAFDSGPVGVGDTFSRPVVEPGTISYRCNFHHGMTGTLVVRAREADRR
ncbi:MAG TPA: hypothetical protein VFQ38_02280 [Longimicrobiales bacterium]|nr:hypothetical protein [Longimicrobiales bacterium]